MKEHRLKIFIITAVCLAIIFPYAINFYKTKTNYEVNQFKKFVEKHIIKSPNWVKDSYSISDINIPGGKNIRLFEAKIENDNTIINLKTRHTFYNKDESLETKVPGLIFATSCDGQMLETYVKSSFQFIDIDTVDRDSIIKEIIYKESERQGLDKLFLDRNIYFNSKDISKFPEELKIMPVLTLADIKGKCIEFSVLPGYYHYFNTDMSLIIYDANGNKIYGRYTFTDFKWLSMNTGNDEVILLISGSDFYMWGEKIVTKIKFNYINFKPNEVVETNENNSDTDVLNYTVFINESDKTYHKENCLYLKNKNSPDILSNVKKSGTYIPCKYCKPNLISGGREYEDNMGSNYVKIDRPGTKVSEHPPHIIYDNSWRQLRR